MIQRLAAGVAVAALTAVGLVAVPAGQADAASYTYCHYGSYTAKSVLLTAHKKAVVTHRHNYTAGPKYSRTTTRSVSEQTVITSSAKLSSEVSASIGDPLIGSASAKLGVSLAKTRHHTATGTKKVTETVKNPTNHNVTMVFFRGNTEGYGTWKRSTCQEVSGAIGQVKWIKGTWRSYGTADDGYVLCGSGTKNIDALAKKAYAQGCG
jgi:hypothetical protein